MSIFAATGRFKSVKIFCLLVQLRKNCADLLLQPSYFAGQAQVFSDVFLKPLQHFIPPNDTELHSDIDIFAIRCFNFYFLAGHDCKRRCHSDLLGQLNQQRQCQPLVPVIQSMQIECHSNSQIIFFVQPNTVTLLTTRCCLGLSSNGSSLTTHALDPVPVAVLVPGLTTGPLVPVPVTCSWWRRLWCAHCWWDRGITHAAVAAGVGSFRQLPHC